MGLFDNYINEILKLLPNEGKSVIDFPSYQQYISNDKEIILPRKQAYVLGGSLFLSCYYTLFTQDTSLINNDEVLIYGNDLSSIKNDTSFACIPLILTDDISSEGEQITYNIIEEINALTYSIFIKGYEVMPSLLSNRYQVRISKKALKNKLSLVHVGKAYIDQFKSNPHVKQVKILFVTVPNVSYLELNKIGLKISDILKNLNHALADVKITCHHHH